MTARHILSRWERFQLVFPHHRNGFFFILMCLAEKSLTNTEIQTRFYLSKSGARYLLEEAIEKGLATKEETDKSRPNKPLFRYTATPELFRVFQLKPIEEQPQTQA